MSLIANWAYPTAIRFGAGRISEIADACSAAGITKPLLITDRGLANMDITTKTLDLLEAAGLGRAIFADVDPNPNEKNAGAGVQAFKDGGHDGVIAFGGGSGLDLGKLVAFLAGQTRSLWDFEDIDDWWTRADADAIAPIVAVPTTAGTGSEVGRASVITNSETEEKKIIFHPKFLPTIVICDPELTVGMPKAITAGTGLDAFACRVPVVNDGQDLVVVIVFVCVQCVFGANHLLVQLFARANPDNSGLGFRCDHPRDVRNLHGRDLLHVDFAANHVFESMPDQFHTLVERDHEACHTRVGDRQHTFTPD